MLPLRLMGLSPVPQGGLLPSRQLAAGAAFFFFFWLFFLPVMADFVHYPGKEAERYVPQCKYRNAVYINQRST